MLITGTVKRIGSKGIQCEIFYTHGAYKPTIKPEPNIIWNAVPGKSYAEQKSEQLSGCTSQAPLGCAPRKYFSLDAQKFFLYMRRAFMSGTL